MNQAENILSSSRPEAGRPSVWRGLPIHFKARPLFPVDEREVKGLVPPMMPAPDVFKVSSQYGIIPQRSQNARDMGDIKDTTVENRKQYVGDVVVLESHLASKTKRTQMYNSRV